MTDRLLAAEWLVAMGGRYVLAADPKLTHAGNFALVRITLMAKTKCFRQLSSLLSKGWPTLRKERHIPLELSKN